MRRALMVGKLNMKFITSAILLAHTLLLSNYSWAKTDHPLISRYPGTEIHSQWIDEYVEYNIPTKAYEQADVLAGKITKAGKVTHTLYKGDRSMSGLRAHKNLEASLLKDGFEIIFQCIGTECGDGRFIDDLHGSPHKMMWINERGSSSNAEKYFSVLSARKVGEKKDFYVVAYINNRHSRGGFKMLWDILETEDIGSIELDVSTDFDAIENSGRTILGGLFFDTGKDALLPKSKPALQEISDYLKENPQRKFLVVGHTDSAGSYDHNIDLSQRRAKSVVDALLNEFSIKTDQLNPVGVAFAAPISSNRNEQGRSQNRRVELVEIP